VITVIMKMEFKLENGQELGKMEIKLAIRVL
jgi:hypothetical protein